MNMKSRFQGRKEVIFIKVIILEELKSEDFCFIKGEKYKALDGDLVLVAFYTKAMMI